MMTLARSYRYFAVLITALLLLLQGASLSHAASYDSGPHEHDGALCVISLQNETDAVLPSPPLRTAPNALANSEPAEFETVFVSAPRYSHRSRGPPPRGPPSK